MPLLKRAAPFDDPEWIFELKYDGFRALAVIEHGRAQLLSRNGHPFASFSALAESISDFLPNVRAVIDGEICSLDRHGKPQFKNLLFHRGNPPCFFAFDLLTYNGKDLRTEPLLDRKQELRRLLAKVSPPFPLRYADHVDGSGTALFQRVCELDLEGIVAKQKFGPYVTEREHSTWFKILNRKYSQKDGREELFERERHSEPVPGWHSCALACGPVWNLRQGACKERTLVVQFAGALATARNSNRSAVAAPQFTTSGFDQAPARCGSKGGPLMISKLADRSGTLIVTVRFIAVLLAALVSGRALAATAPLFLPAVTYDSGGIAPRSVTAADVNGDGKPDLPSLQLPAERLRRLRTSIQL